jgi:hypothetical protein
VPKSPKVTDLEVNNLFVKAPYDQAVAFLANPITHLPPAAYYQYNYK